MPVAPLRIVDASSLRLPFAGTVVRADGVVLVVRSNESPDARALSFLVPDPLNITIPTSGAVHVHASIRPAPDFDLVLGEGPPQLVPSRGAYAAGVYWLAIGDADRGTVKAFIGPPPHFQRPLPPRPHDESWTGGMRGAFDIVERMERRRGTWRPGYRGELALLAARMNSWTRTESGACLVVDRVDPAPR